MKFTLEIELGNDGIANRSDLERALLRVASNIGFVLSQGFSNRPSSPVQILGEQSVESGIWEIKDDPEPHAFKTGLCNLCHEDEVHQLHAADLVERIAQNERRHNNREG